VLPGTGDAETPVAAAFVGDCSATRARCADGVARHQSGQAPRRQGYESDDIRDDLAEHHRAGDPTAIKPQDTDYD